MLAGREKRALALGALLMSALALGGCSSLASWIPSIPPPSFDWFSSSKKPAPLPEFKPIASPRVAWQVPVGKATPGLAPAITSDAIYAASATGTIVTIGKTCMYVANPCGPFVTGMTSTLKRRNHAVSIARLEAMASLIR